MFSYLKLNRRPLLTFDLLEKMFRIAKVLVFLSFVVLCFRPGMLS